MPRKPDPPDWFLTLDENLRVVATPTRHPKRKRARRRLTRDRSFATQPGTEEFRPLPRFLRNRNLLMAALRLWELRNGFHDSW